MRTHLVEELADLDVGATVRLAGWISFKRIHKRVAFVGLRDRSGTVQLVTEPSVATKVPQESCVVASGVVGARPPRLGSVGLPVEVKDATIEVLNPAARLPFSIEGGEPSRGTRLRWRYLDMRREDLRRALLFRAEVGIALRRWAEDQGFRELATPFLAHPSSGGAREFIVTSQDDSDRKYALPQSSQVYRTLLMTGGIERFYQLTRNFRDEWTRSDRQPEFSVLDLEAAFIDRDDIIAWVEDAITHVVGVLLGQDLEKPFPRISFGQDLPSSDGSLKDAGFVWAVDHPLFETHEGILHTFHQPFDAPEETSIHVLERSPLACRSTYFTLTCRGAEVGGGSMRIHQAELLSSVLRLIGQEGTNSAVVEALRYGTPPHGGFTLALESLAAALLGQSIRMLTPFPKTGSGRCPVFSDAQDE